MKSSESLWHGCSPRCSTVPVYVHTRNPARAGGAPSTAQSLSSLIRGYSLSESSRETDCKFLYRSGYSSLKSMNFYFASANDFCIRIQGLVNQKGYRICRGSL